MKKFLIGLLISLSLLGTGCSTQAKDAEGNATWASTKIIVVDRPNGGQVYCVVVFEVAGVEPHGIDCDW